MKKSYIAANILSEYNRNYKRYCIDCINRDSCKITVRECKEKELKNK